MQSVPQRVLQMGVSVVDHPSLTGLIGTSTSMRTLLTIRISNSFSPRIAHRGCVFTALLHGPVISLRRGSGEDSDNDMTLMNVLWHPWTKLGEKKVITIEISFFVNHIYMKIFSFYKNAQGNINFCTHRFRISIPVHISYYLHNAQLIMNDVVTNGPSTVKSSTCNGKLSYRDCRFKIVFF